MVWDPRHQLQNSFSLHYILSSWTVLIHIKLWHLSLKSQSLLNSSYKNELLSLMPKPSNTATPYTQPQTKMSFFFTFAHSSLPSHSQYPCSFTKSNWFVLPILKCSSLLHHNNSPTSNHLCNILPSFWHLLMPSTSFKSILYFPLNECSFQNMYLVKSPLLKRGFSLFLADSNP